MKIFVEGSVFQIPATGIAKSTLELYKHIIKLDPNINVVILHKNELKTVLPPEIRSVQFGSFLPLSIWRKILLPIYINIKNPDIVHFPWNGRVPPFLNNKKIITTIFDLIPLKVPGFFKNSKDELNFRKTIQNSIDRSNIIITSSKYSKKDILSEFNLKEEPSVIYIGPTINCKTEINNKKSEYFLYVGGYDKRKGIEELIETFQELFKGNKVKSKLIITGDKNYYSPYLKELIDNGVKQGFLEEKGYVSESELCSLYKGANALVYLSSYEGFGLPPLEAMIMECPVITTRATSIPEVCGDAVYYVDVNNDKELSEALVALEKDDELRNRLKSLGKIQSTKFSWDLIAKQFLEKIKKL